MYVTTVTAVTTVAAVTSFTTLFAPGQQAHVQWSVASWQDIFVTEFEDEGTLFREKTMFFQVPADLKYLTHLHIKTPTH